MLNYYEINDFFQFDDLKTKYYLNISTLEIKMRLIYISI